MWAYDSIPLAGPREASKAFRYRWQPRCRFLSVFQLQVTSVMWPSRVWLDRLRDPWCTTLGCAGQHVTCLKTAACLPVSVRKPVLGAVPRAYITSPVGYSRRCHRHRPRLALRAGLLLSQSGGVGRGGGVGGQRRLVLLVGGTHEPSCPSWFAKYQTKVIFVHMTWR